MNEQIKKIKITSEVDGALIAEIENSIKNIKGVLDAKFDIETSVITYVLDMWASDYDVMVLIMNVLGDNYSVESEPYFEEDGEEESEEIIYAPSSEETEESEEVEIDEETVKKQDARKEIKFKFIEVGLSLLCVIIGLILNGNSKTSHISPYLYTIAFALSSYDFILSTVLNVIKKKINFGSVTLLIALISSLILAVPLGGALLMIVYTTISTFYELFKFDFVEKHGFDFNLKASAKLNVISGIVYGAVLFICLFIVFIVPIFLGDYSNNLLVCAEKATAILLVFAVTPSLFYIPLSFALIYAQAVKNGTKIAGEETYKKLANVKKVAFLGQSVFLNDDGSLKENALGSVMELYDAKIEETVLLSKKSKEETSKLRKELSIIKSVSNLSDSQKNDEVIALNGGVLAVGNLKTNASVTLSLSEKPDFDVCVIDGNLKKIPFVIKLCKRFKSIVIQNAVLSLLTKIVVATLCGFGVITNLAVAVIPIIAVEILTVLNAVRNNLEII